VRQDGATPLFIASENGQVEVVGVLLAKGADVEAKTNVRAS
jgi:ankyrin repeat protein